MNKLSAKIIKVITLSLVVLMAFPMTAVAKKRHNSHKTPTQSHISSTTKRKITASQRISKQLLTAIKAKDLEKVKKIVNENVGNFNINEAIPFEFDKNALIEQNFYYPLLLACRVEDFDIIDFLIKDENAKADINGSPNYSITPLIGAVRQRQKELIKYLIDNGADVNYQSFGQSALLEAAGAYYDSTKPIDLDVIKLLVEYKAERTKPDLFLTDQMGRGVLHHAANTENFSAITYLLPKMMKLNPKIVDAKDNFDNTPLLAVGHWHVSQTYDQAIMELFIEKGANILAVTYMDGKEETILHRAAQYSSWEALNYLIYRPEITKEIFAKYKDGIMKAAAEDWDKERSKKKITILKERIKEFGAN